MNKTPHLTEPNRRCSLLLAACLALPLSPGAAQTASAQGPVYSVTDSGAFYRVWESTASFSGDVTGPGAISLTTPSGQVFQSHPIGLY